MSADIHKTQHSDEQTTREVIRQHHAEYLTQNYLSSFLLEKCAIAGTYDN